MRNKERTAKIQFHAKARRTQSEINQNSLCDLASLHETKKVIVHLTLLTNLK